MHQHHHGQASMVDDNETKQPPFGKSNNETEANKTNGSCWSEYSNSAFSKGYYCGISFPSRSQSVSNNTNRKKKSRLQKNLTIPGIGNETELIIAMTMYNESEVDLKRTMKGVCHSLINLQSDSDAYPQMMKSSVVTVVLIADGEDCVDEGTKSWLKKSSIFDPNHLSYTNAQDEDDEVVMHIFASVHNIRNFLKDDKIPINMEATHTLRFVYLLKKKNAKKLDSHSWILEGLAPILHPNYVVFLDVGTRPKKSAIRMLIKEMKDDENVAGCCGEITIDRPYQRAQKQCCSPVIMGEYS